HALAVQTIHVRADGLPHQAHQRLHLVGGATPILGGEGVDGEHRDGVVVAEPDGAPQRLDPGTVAQGAWQVALGRPAAIAIHDDGDVPRHSLPLAEVELGQLRVALRLPCTGATVEHSACHMQPITNPSLTHHSHSHPSHVSYALPSPARWVAGLS